MTAPLRRSVLLSIIALASLVSGSAGSAPEIMKGDELKPILGKWFITSFELDPISAISSEQAKEFVGQVAYFDEGIVQFGNKTCKGPTYRLALSLTPGWTFDIIIDCEGGQIVPNLAYNQRSKLLVAQLDGATYALNREPPKGR